MLAINTAFMTANLALSTKDGRVFTEDINSNSKHSENVLKTIDSLCQKASIDILDVETVAVVVGPGSFTGLRIGTSIAKGLAYVDKNLNLITLSSLELMAYITIKHHICAEEFVCVINALSDLFFVAYFDKNGVKLHNEKLIDRKEFNSIKCQKISLVGDLPEEKTKEIEITSIDLLEFAKNEENRKNFVTINEMEPKYLRLSQAEDNLLKKSKKC